MTFGKGYNRAIQFHVQKLRFVVPRYRLRRALLLLLWVDWTVLCVSLFVCFVLLIRAFVCRLVYLIVAILDLLCLLTSLGYI